MHVSARLAGFVVIGLLAVSRPSFADTAAETATKWDLLGTWMNDCSKPPTATNAPVRYVVEAGDLHYDRTLGPDGETDSNKVLSATIKADGSIELVVEFHGALPVQTRQFSLVKREDGRVRVMSNSALGGHDYSIVNGIVVDNGNATPWRSHCH